MLAKFSRLTLPPAIVVAALVVYRLVMATVTPNRGPMELPRNEPWIVTSELREPRICSDEQLAQVLDRVQPPRDGLTTNHIVHALRLWGDQADFGDPAIPSGRVMRDYLLDDRIFRSLAGPESPPLFFRGKDGLDVRSYDDLASFQQTSSYHSDDILATLAESGIPLDATIRLRNGEKAKVADLLEGTRQRFYLDRLEYEWSIIAFVRYGHPLKPWRNKYGEKIDIAGLVKELTDKPAEIGPCDGLHRLEALAVLYRIDQMSPALPPRVKHRLLSYMKRVSDQLALSQSVEGYWSSGWSRTSQLQSEGPTLHDKLLVTGHHLEWLALAPEEAQPPRETIVRAGQWLTRTLLEMDSMQLHKAYGPYSHAARALCLWKGVEPVAAWGERAEVREQRAEVGGQGEVKLTLNLEP
ncbi:MAG TPA: hypothetical protein VMP01_17115 [Pirellulaceae bacterium]|nr:hypothetical protein [Pirellulaceae bacterium]